MAQGGGKPGIVFKGYGTAEPNERKIIVQPSEDESFIWDYFQKAGVREFTIQFLYSYPEHSAGNADEQKDA